MKRRRIEELSLDPANTRTHSERSVEAIAASLRRFGQQKPVIVDSKGVVRAGNGMVMAAKSIGWEEINTVETDLSGPDLIAYSIADNRTSDLSEWDFAVLTTTLESLRLEDPQLLLDTGWSEQEIVTLQGMQGDFATPEEDFPHIRKNTILVVIERNRDEVSKAVELALEPFGGDVDVRASWN